MSTKRIAAGTTHAIPDSPEFVDIPQHLRFEEGDLRPTKEMMFNSFCALRDTGLSCEEVSRLLGYRVAIGQILEKSYRINWARGHLDEARTRVLAFAEGRAINGIEPTPKIVYDANCRIQDLAGEVIQSRDVSDSRGSQRAMSASEVIEIERRIKTFYISEGVRQDDGGAGHID